jgi:hypothetical protein
MVWKRKPTRNKNPYATNNQHTHGQKSEIRVIKNLGAVQVIASGAIEGLKSDGVLDHFRVECKSTVKKSMSIKWDWLIKIRNEALETNRCPVLTLSFVDDQGKAERAGDWAVIPLHEFLDYVQWKKENGDEI